MIATSQDGSRTIKLTIAYDGSEFHGWQIQSGQQTVQGVLTDALQRLTQHATAVHGAGLTDAGVHAWGQVAHFQTHASLSPAEFNRALNALLPESIRIRDVDEVSADFHSRWSARRKTYVYRIYRGRVMPPFVSRYMLHYPYPLDFTAMASAARLFQGEHDFSSFAGSSGDAQIDRQRTMIRGIDCSEFVMPPSASQTVDVSRPQSIAAAVHDMPRLHMQAATPMDDEWIYIVSGRSFLRSMVRKIVGTLIEVGRGRLQPEDIPRLLDLRDPSCSGPTAAPHGLCLLCVEYD